MKALSNVLLFDHLVPVHKSFELMPKLFPNVTYQVEMPSYFNSTADKLILSGRINGTKVLHHEHDAQVFANVVQLIFKANCIFTNIEYEFDENPSGMCLFLVIYLQLPDIFMFQWDPWDPCQLATQKKRFFPGMARFVTFHCKEVFNFLLSYVISTIMGENIRITKGITFSISNVFRYYRAKMLGKRTILRG